MLPLLSPAIAILYLFLLCFALQQIQAQPEGWKMTDRFYGFRYEIFGDDLEASILSKIQEEADNLACFGWVQESPSRTIVGEARCTKARGPVFQEKLQKLNPKISKVDVLVYEDTKIRLHFSTFKILPKERETCFLDAPHQCKEYSKSGQGTKGSSNEERYRADEL